MTFDLHIQIDDQSPEALALETIARRERVSPEDAVKRILKAFAVQTDPDNFDHLFTPEKIAFIRAAEAEAEQIINDETRIVLSAQEHARLEELMDAACPPTPKPRLQEAIRETPVWDA